MLKVHQAAAVELHRKMPHAGDTGGKLSYGGLLLTVYHAGIVGVVVVSLRKRDTHVRLEGCCEVHLDGVGSIMSWLSCDRHAHLHRIIHP